MIHSGLPCRSARWVSGYPGTTLEFSGALHPLVIDESASSPRLESCLWLQAGKSMREKDELKE